MLIGSSPNEQIIIFHDFKKYLHLSGFSLGGWLVGWFLTIGHCFPIVFWNFLCAGDKTFDGGDAVVIGDLPSPPLGKTMLIKMYYT